MGSEQFCRHCLQWNQWATGAAFLCTFQKLWVLHLLHSQWCFLDLELIMLSPLNFFVSCLLESSVWSCNCISFIPFSSVKVFMNWTGTNSSQTCRERDERSQLPAQAACRAWWGSVGIAQQGGKLHHGWVWLRNVVIQSFSASVPCDRHSASDKLFCCHPNKLF